MQNKFITTLTLTAFIFVTIFSPFPTPVKTASAETAVINTGSLRLVTNTTGFSFKMDLMQGDTDPAVKELQKVLNSSPDTAISGNGVGSPGQESTYFGASTKAAVIKFQEKYKNDILTPNGLTAGTGLVGKATRTKLNQLLGVTTPTLASVGQPQSRAGTGAAPAQTVETGVSVCKFIDLMAGINVVSAERANSARVTMKCTTVTPVITPTPSTGMNVCSFIDLLVGVGIVTSEKANQARPIMNCPVNNAPSVVVKVNGSKGPIQVLPGTDVRLSWHSENTKSCSDGVSTWPVSGSVVLKNVTTTLSYPVSCIGINGNSVVDSAVVVVSTSTQATSSIEVLSSSIIPGYNFATFEAETNVPTKMVVGYAVDPTATSSVKIYESSVFEKKHSHKISNLLPNTQYFANVFFITEEDDKAMTPLLTFTTLADGVGGELVQRVLSSEGGNGVVSIPDSESLKTDSKVTLEAWVKPTAWSTNIGLNGAADSVIISRGQIGGNVSYVLSLENGKLVYSNNNSSIWTSMPVVPLNKWTHVAVSVSEAANNITFYVNGEKINSVNQGMRGVFNKSATFDKTKAITEYDATATSTTAHSSNTNTTAESGGWGSEVAVPASPSSDTIESLLPKNMISNVYIGNFYPALCNATTTEGNGFIGFIDDVKIWNVARTAEQIKKDAATSTASTTGATANNQETGLVAHYSFDDGRATDLTMNMNNGAVKGDMEIVDDETAVSPIIGSAFALAGLEFNFPESCDSNLFPEEEATMPAGYKITFKGGVKSVTPSGKFYVVELETCNDPTEDLVKSVEVVGKAPPRTADYYNSMGTISVVIVPSFNMKVPAVRDTIQGTSLDYITNPISNTVVVPKGTNSNANSVGYATNWQPQPGSCMKKDKGMMGNFAVIGAVVLVVAAALSCIYAACAFVPFLTGYASAGVAGGAAILGGTTAATVGAGAVVGTSAVGAYAAAAGAVVVAAGVGYSAGSMVSCEDGSTGCSGGGN